MCRQIGVVEDGISGEPFGVTTVVQFHMVHSKEKAAIEMQLRNLQIKFNERTNTEQLKVVLWSL